MRSAGDTTFSSLELADNTTYEQWSSEGSVESHTRARARAVEMLAAYEAPELDPATDEALRAFIAKRMDCLLYTSPSPRD